MRDNRRVAVVVGSGGIKCAAVLGLWQALGREGIEISMAVGSSGGSIYAALMALGYDAATAEAKTVDLWTPDLMSGYTSQLRAVQSGASRFTERSGLADGERLNHRLHTVFGEQTFADAGFPLYIVSTDLYSGEPVVHNTGRVVDAISSSILSGPLTQTRCLISSRLGSRPRRRRCPIFVDCWKSPQQPRSGPRNRSSYLDLPIG